MLIYANNNFWTGDKADGSPQQRPLFDTGAGSLSSREAMEEAKEFMADNELTANDTLVVLSHPDNSSTFARAALASYYTGLYSIYCGREGDVNGVLHNVKNAVVIGDSNSKLTYTGDNIKKYVDVKADAEMVEARLAQKQLDKIKDEEAILMAEKADRVKAVEEARLAQEDADRLKAVEEARLAQEEADRVKAVEEARLAQEEADRVKAEEEARLADAKKVEAKPVEVKADAEKVEEVKADKVEKKVKAKKAKAKKVEVKADAKPVEKED